MVLVRRGNRVAFLSSQIEDGPSCPQAVELKIWGLDEIRDCWVLGDLSSVG